MDNFEKAFVSKTFEIYIDKTFKAYSENSPLVLKQHVIEELAVMVRLIERYDIPVGPRYILEVTQFVERLSVE
jgi:hypothetical protein